MVGMKCGEVSCQLKIMLTATNDISVFGLQDHFLMFLKGLLIAQVQEMRGGGKNVFILICKPPDLRKIYF